MAKRKSNWSKMIEEAGFRIRIYERPNGAGVYFSFIIDGKKTQRSTRRTDRKEAEEYAREVVRLVAQDRLLGRSGPVKLGEVFRAYAEHKEPLLASRPANLGNEPPKNLPPCLGSRTGDR